MGAFNWNPANSTLDQYKFAGGNSNANPGAPSIAEDPYLEMYGPAGKMIAQTGLNYAKNKGTPEFSHIDERTGESVFKVADWANTMFDYPMQDGMVLNRDLSQLHAKQDYLDKQEEIKKAKEAETLRLAEEAKNKTTEPSGMDSEFLTPDGGSGDVLDVAALAASSLSDSDDEKSFLEKFYDGTAWQGTHKEWLLKHKNNEFQLGNDYDDPGQSGAGNLWDKVTTSSNTYYAFNYIHDFLKNPTGNSELGQNAYQEQQSDVVDEVRLWMEGSNFKATPVLGATTSNAWKFFKENPTEWQKFKQSPVEWYWTNKKQYKLKPKAEGFAAILDDDHFSQNLADGKYSNLEPK